MNDRFQQYVNVASEEVALLTYDSTKDVVWSAFHFSSESESHKNTGAELGGGIDIQKQKLVTQIERSGKLDGDATTTFLAQHDGTRVIALDLFATLRVQNDGADLRRAGQWPGDSLRRRARIQHPREATMVGNNTMEQSVPLGQVKEAPKRAMINYYYDVLAIDK